MKRVLVTGGAGFVGSSIAIGLKKEHASWSVAALDNLRRRGSELNLPRLREHGVEFVHGDIRNREDLEGLERADLVIECSAEPSVLAGYNGSPAYVFNTNLAGTFNCLEAARSWSADFIFLSTSRVYPISALNRLRYSEDETRFILSDDQELPGVSARGISTLFPLIGRRSLYGATKLSSEHLIEEYASMYGLRCVVNRCGVITGPWQMGKADQGVFVHWMLAHYFRRELSYLGFGGRGKQVRDLLHADDLVAFVKWEALNMEKVLGRVLNIGGGPGCSLSLAETTEACALITGNRIRVGSNAADRAGDVRIYLTDTGEAESATGWRPSRGARDALKDIFCWIRANERALKGVL